MVNPFVTIGYVGPEYFCDREQETAELIGALRNGRNVAFISPRRLGKTGLIHHAFNRMRREDIKARCYYMDIFSTQNKEDFVALFAKTILGSLDTPAEKLIAEASRILRHCRPLFSVDPLSGMPTVSIDMRPNEAEASLQDVMQYMQESGYSCYVAIDEFQQITEYPDKGIDAALRGLMQVSPNVHFVFAGSKQHLMTKLFTMPSQPFFQSVQKMGLSPLPKDTYYSFACDHMRRGGKSFPQEVFDEIYRIARGYTWYIQDILNRLYELPQDELTIHSLHDILIHIKMEGDSSYKDYCELLAKGQLRLLRAIADEDVVQKPFDAEFMRRYHLTAVSSVKLALDALVKANIVAKSEEGYYIYDRYWSLWLKQS